MGIFDSIKNAIFGGAEAAPADEPTTKSAPTVSAPPKPSAPDAPAPASAPPVATPNPPTVDVAATLDQAVANKGQKLDWRHSIVDLMKALDLDSSLGARKELANELNYTGDTNDSATMNMWLHKALMTKLAENGGKVPPELTA